MSSRELFDRPLLRKRRARAARLAPATFLVDRVAEDLADRLAAVLRSFPLGVDLATPTAAVGDGLTASNAVTTVGTIDATAADAQGRAALRVVVDAEALPFRDASLDLVVSGL